jgi:hypothetical protein
MIGYFAKLRSPLLLPGLHSLKVPPFFVAHDFCSFSNELRVFGRLALALLDEGPAKQQRTKSFRNVLFCPSNVFLRLKTNHFCDSVGRKTPLRSALLVTSSSFEI